MADEPPFSIDFQEKPPTCDITETTLKFPCKGKDEEAFDITVMNTGRDRLTYKVSGNEKFCNFILAEPFGYIEAASSKAINVQPKPMKNSNGWNKLDHLVVTVGPAPKGDLWDPVDIWKPHSGAEPKKQVKTFKINLKT